MRLSNFFKAFSDPTNADYLSQAAYRSQFSSDRNPQAINWGTVKEYFHYYRYFYRCLSLDATAPCIILKRTFGICNENEDMGLDQYPNATITYVNALFQGANDATRAEIQRRRDLFQQYLKQYAGIGSAMTLFSAYIVQSGLSPAPVLSMLALAASSYFASSPSYTLFNAAQMEIENKLTSNNRVGNNRNEPTPTFRAP